MSERGRLTLHEAMVEVLRAHGGGWMHRDDIAREIGRRDLFRRPTDGRHPPSDQIRLRARKPEYHASLRVQRHRLHEDPPSPGCRRGSPAEPRSAIELASRRNGQHSQGWGCCAEDLDQWGSNYRELREQYRPNELKILLIGESPPDPGEGVLRFFYAPTLSYDNLYRGVAQALYGDRNDVDLGDKPSVLKRIRDDGFWLIDAVEYPANKLSSSARDRAISDAVPGLVQRCLKLAPERGVIICHGKVYAAASDALRAAGVKVLHDNPLPFPLGNWRGRFVQGFREALANG